MFPASRMLGDEIEATEMTGVEHLGKYVYEMTKAKIESLNAGGGQLPVVEETLEMMKVDREEDDDDGEGLLDEAVEEEEEQEEDIDGVA